MRYQVTAPEAGFDGLGAGGIRFREGVAIVDSEIPAEHKALQYFRQAGYPVVQVDEDGNPVEAETGSVESSVVDEDGNENPLVTEPVPLPPLPAPGANKPEWVEAARLRGWSVEDADAMLKPDLIAAVTAYDEANQRASENPEGGQE